MKLVVAGIVGCGLCCLPFLFPLAAGVMGISVFGFALTHILCGVFFLFLALALYGTYLAMKKKVCVGPARE